MSKSVAERETYTAVCEREGGWWSVSVPELPGVFTQARRLDQVVELVTDAIALWLEIEPESFEVVLAPHISDPIDESVEQALEARRLAEYHKEAAAAHSRSVARELVDKGLSMRDAGVILGVSHQRIKQLVDD